MDGKRSVRETRENECNLRTFLQILVELGLRFGLAASGGKVGAVFGMFLEPSGGGN
jgi:hypothetical protein